MQNRSRTTMMMGLMQGPTTSTRKANEKLSLWRPVIRIIRKATASMKEINTLKRELAQKFEMKDLGPANPILGMRISRDRAAGTLTLSQEKYINKVLDRFRVQDAKPYSFFRFLACCPSLLLR